MKTILLVSRCPPYPLHLGDRLILWHLTRELSARGHVIDLLALHDRADDPRWIDACRSAFRHIALFPEEPRARKAYLRRLLLPSSRFPKTAAMSFNPRLWREIAARLRDNDYDIVHCFGSVSVYEFHPLFAHLPNLITPYESHTLYLQSAARAGHLSAKLRLPIVRRYERFMFQPFDRAVVIAEKDRDMLLSLQPSLNVDVIPNGIDLPRFPWRGEGRDPETLLFVGNFAYPPNQDAARLFLKSIMPAIWQQTPRVTLQLVGSSPPDWMRQQADDRVEITGHVPDVQPYLARAAAFVCPLRIGAGLKNKALEALAMGIPLVATPLSVDGISVVDGESAILAEVDGIATATLQLLRDDKLRRRLPRNGRELVESAYTWEQTAARYEQLYDALTLK